MDNQIVNQLTQTSKVSPLVTTPVPLPLANPTTEPAQNPPKNSNLFLTILIIVIIILGIIFGVLVTKLLSDSTKSATSSVSPSINVEGTEDWLTYSNRQLKYSIKYPPSWTLTEKLKGKLIEIYNQPDKTKLLGEIFIEKISLPPININEYVDTVGIGNIQARCFSDQDHKTWCYLENGKSVKISLLIIKDQDETNNLILYKILSTFNITIEPAWISEEQLTAGWYWGNKEQKLPGTPLTWIYSNGSNSPCWHKRGVVCQVAPSTANYTCPSNGWVDCMPVIDAAKTATCSVEAMAWYKTNCPNFQGAAF